MEEAGWCRAEERAGGRSRSPRASRMCPSSAAMELSTRRLRARRVEAIVDVRFGAADSDGPAYGDSSSTLVKRESEA